MNEAFKLPWLETLGIIQNFKDIKLNFRKHRRARFLSHFNLPKKGSVLDISCGCGCALNIFHHHSPTLTLHGIDMSKETIEEAKQNCPAAAFSVARAECLPYKEQRFDVVISCHALHHYKKPEQVFDEVSRVLAHGGIFYINDIFPKHRLMQWFQNYHGCSEPYHFEKYYTKQDVASLAASKRFYIHAYTKTGWFSEVQVIALKKLKT